MILKYPKKGESIYKLNPVLEYHDEFSAIKETKMRFVTLFADKVDSPFVHKVGEELAMAVAKSIPEMWDGKMIRQEFVRTVDLKDVTVLRAIKLFDELFNPATARGIIKRIADLEKLSEQQSKFLTYGDTIKVGDDKADKYQAVCDRFIKDGILEKTTEKIMLYHKLLSEQNVLPLEVVSSLDATKEKEVKDNTISETADSVDIDKIAKEN